MPSVIKDGIHLAYETWGSATCRRVIEYIANNKQHYGKLIRSMAERELEVILDQLNDWNKHVLIEGEETEATNEMTDIAAANLEYKEWSSQMGEYAVDTMPVNRREAMTNLEKRQEIEEQILQITKSYELVPKMIYPPNNADDKWITDEEPLKSRAPKILRW